MAKKIGKHLNYNEDFLQDISYLLIQLNFFQYIFILQSDKASLSPT